MLIPFPLRLLYQVPFLFPRIFNRELYRLYFVFLLRNFAVGMIAIFEPIYYLNYFEGSVSSVLLLYAALFLCMGILCYFVVQFAGSFGIKRTIMLSYPLMLGYYFLLWNIDASPLMLPLSFILWLSAVLLFWMPINVYFGLASNKKQLGSQVGQFYALVGLSFAIGPVVGGLILAHLGWSYLFSTVILLLFLTSIALFFSPEIREPYRVSLKLILKDVSQLKFLPRASAFDANGAENMIKGTLWPILLFVLAIGFDSIGFIAAGALIVGTAFTLYIGSLTDRVPRTRLVAIGSLLLAISWFIKVFVRTPLNALFANVFYGMTSAAAVVPFTAIFYNDFDTARSHSIVLREISLNVGRAVVLSLLALAFLKMPNAFPFAFVSAALLAPLFNLIYFKR